MWRSDGSSAGGGQTAHRPPRAWRRSSLEEIRFFVLSVLVGAPVEGSFRPSYSCVRSEAFVASELARSRGPGDTISSGAGGPITK